MDIKQLREVFSKHGIEKVKVGGFDVDGVLRGKYVSLEKFWSAVDTGFGFCDVIFGWDITDALYDNARVTGWHTGYPDAHARIDLSTYRRIPWEPKTAAFLVDFVRPDGSPHPACPRSLLRQVTSRARAAGFTASFAAEFEFFVFKETPETMRAKGYKNLTPLSAGMFGYSWLREGQNSDFCHAILDQMAAFDIELEALHTETGPGVYEVAIRYDDALRMADKAALFKTAMKQLATRMGLSVTFMAKHSASLAGSSGHLHQSLWTTDRPRNLFFDEYGQHRMSDIARRYLGGQLALMPGLTALYAPTVNSYKRYVPGVWAPLNATWGVDNRTCAIRAISGDSKSTRFEYRQTAADMNPHIAIATALGAGLWGIAHDAVAPAESKGDASRDAIGGALPRTLREAITRLEGCPEAREILTPEFVDHYLRTRDWEARQYERAVTDWELERYFESI